MQSNEANTIPAVWPLVSAVIPTRNRPDLVCRAVRSILAQGYPNVEAVVVIDGPDPPTVAALNALNDPRISIVALLEPVGGSEARNEGVRHARGEWIGLLDDDDEWLPEKIAKQLRIAEKSKPAGTVVMCRFFLRSANGSDVIMPRRMLRSDESAVEYIFDPAGGFKTSTFFCSRKLLLAVPFTRGLKGCQDPDWLLKVVAAGDHHFIIADQVLAVYYAPASTSNVSRRLDVGFKLDWIRSHRRLLSRRAYSMFIVTMCAPTAAKRFSIWEFCWLLQECVIAGSATPMMLLHYMSLYFLPASVRHRIRDCMDTLQRGKTRAST